METEPKPEIERHPKFEAFKAERLKNPAIRAAYERARLRELTYGLDKRQARRLRRRLGKTPG